MKLTIIRKPYDDEKLIFNQNSGRYELTVGYVKANFGNNFFNDEVLKKRIGKNSRKIYNFINSRSYSANLTAVSFCLNHTEEGRKFLLEVLAEQMEADLETGYNDISSQPAINFASGQVIPREQQILNQITVDTENLIYKSALYFGFDLVTLAPLPTMVYLAVQRAMYEGE